MKFIYLLVFPALLSSQLAMADSENIYKWKFVQNNEISNLTFKNKAAAKTEKTLRKVIRMGFIEEFCSTEKNLLKTHLQEMSSACIIKEKQITEDFINAHMMCEETQEIKLKIKKHPDGYYEGISRIKSDNKNFTIYGYSMIKIRPIGECNTKEIEAMKKKK